MTDSRLESVYVDFIDPEEPEAEPIEYCDHCGAELEDGFCFACNLEPDGEL